MFQLHQGGGGNFCRTGLNSSLSKSLVSQVNLQGYGQNGDSYVFSQPNPPALGLQILQQVTTTAAKLSLNNDMLRKAQEFVQVCLLLSLNLQVSLILFIRCSQLLKLLIIL